MRAMVSSRSARTIGLTLAAGLLAFEAVLALSAGAIGIPGVLLVPLAKEVTAASVTGETVIAKLDEVPVAVKPVPQPKAVQPEASAPAGEPNLAGLADIPVDMPWKHDANNPPIAKMRQGPSRPTQRDGRCSPGMRSNRCRHLRRQAR